MYVWNPLALPGMVIAPLFLLLAAAIYLTRPDQWQNRFLAIFVFAGGLSGFLWFGLRLVVEDAAVARSLGVAAYLGILVTYWAYLLFLSTLPTSWAAPLRHPLGRALVHVWFGGLAVALVVDSSLFLPAAVPFGVYPGWDLTVGPWRRVFLVFLAFEYVLSVVLAVAAYMAARTAILRGQMRAYVVAFVGGDVAWLLMLVHRLTGQPITGPLGDKMMLFLLPVLGLAWTSGWLTFGILRFQLFDIRIRVRGLVHRGTLAAVLVFVVVLGGELLESAFAGASYVFGIAIAVVIAAALYPMERFARRVSARVVPSADDPDDLAVRREEVYRAAFEGAMDEDVITPKERRTLDTLARRLELPPNDVIRIERETVAWLESGQASGGTAGGTLKHAKGRQARQGRS